LVDAFSVVMQDTVVDAGMYDGTLGIICAISAVKALKISGKLEKLQRPIEVISFVIEVSCPLFTSFEYVKSNFS
jgi:allantoate deiminase